MRRTRPYSEGAERRGCTRKASPSFSESARKGRPKDSGGENGAPGNVQREPNPSVSDSKISASAGNPHQPQEATSECVQSSGKCKQNLPTEHKASDEDCHSEATKLQPEISSSSKKEIPPADFQHKQVKTKEEVRDSKVAVPSVSGVKDQPKSSDIIAFVSAAPRSSSINIVKRPNYGTVGKRIELVANYFLLEGRGKNIHHYDVEIVETNRKTAKARTIKEDKVAGATQLEIQQKRNVGKQKCREIINQLITIKKLENLYPFYDGHKNLYTFKPLPITGKATAKITLSGDGRPKDFTVVVQAATKNGVPSMISLDSLNAVCEGSCAEIPAEAVMVFDMLLCHRNPPFKEVNVGRSFFSFSEFRKTPLDGEIEIWKGYNQSVHLTERGPALVVNVANKAFHSAGFVIEHACSILGFDITSRNLKADEIQKLTKSLANIKVEVTHLPYPRKYTVTSVTKKSARELIVDIEGRDMSVAQFFEQKYKRLKFPQLPCLTMRSTGRPTYVPMEVCAIPPGQPKLGKLNKTQTSQMINQTAIPPSERFEAIKNYADIIKRTSGPHMNQSGMQMQLTPLNFSARVITPPRLTYKELTISPDTRGVWRIDGQNFSKSSSNVRWALISFADQRRCSTGLLKDLSNAIVTGSQKVGLHLNQPVAIEFFDERTSTENALRYAMKKRVDFVFAVLSRDDRHHNYDELKFIADLQLGLITQCMEDIVVPRSCDPRGGGQIINNLLSKLNIKLGGINHTLSQQPSISMKQTIVMGADAAHSPRGSRCPSIAAVVGSIDNVPFQYAVSCRIQKNPDESKLSQEIILDMKEMTKHILSSYVEKNRVPPERIIFFRDGVSEGQFETVLKKELTLIQRACNEMFKKTLKVTFIVVQKRHQTRFKPRDPRDGIGRYQNVPPGTTVDTDVVHPVYFDFFICSHEGIKGTSKPAHYVVLHDDNGFLADDLQKFCYELCHVYARCNRSISIPAPAMNAHLAAARAKKYVDWYLLGESNSSSGYSSDDTYSLPQHMIDSVQNISTIKAPMFFV